MQALKWFFYEFMGVRAVWERIKPLTDEEKKTRRPAPTFVLWFVGIYTALFGLASARYENAVDRVEIRAGAVVALMANDNVRTDAARQVFDIQQRTVPKKPDFLAPTFIESFWEHETHQEAVDMMKTAIESCKRVLKGVDLAGVDLRGSSLYEANLQGAQLRSTILIGANLIGANLRDADLSFAHLSESSLKFANLREVRLYYTNLRRVNLSGANIERAYLRNVDLIGANLEGVNLIGATISDVDLEGADLSYAELSGAKLYRAHLEGADLQGANFRDSDLWGANLSSRRLIYTKIDNNTCWQEIFSMNGAIIDGWEKMPIDFVVFAFINGAEILDR